MPEHPERRRSIPARTGNVSAAWPAAWARRRCPHDRVANASRGDGEPSASRTSIRYEWWATCADCDVALVGTGDADAGDVEWSVAE